MQADELELSRSEQVRLDIVDGCSDREIANLRNMTRQAANQIRHNLRREVLRLIMSKRRGR